MWISYQDSEVNKFHPVCEDALNEALYLSGHDDKYRVLHHQYTGSLEMDFVIQNKETGKYLCVIEVKRTPNDIHSARYQYQSMSYVQMNGSESERPFYIITNLEYAFSFRYDSNRTRIFQQMLKPGLVTIGKFAEEELEFKRKLANFFKIEIENFISNKYEYLVTLEEFALHMENLKDNTKQWKTHLAVLLYEYIRGAFTFLNRNELRDIRLFRNDVERICKEAAKVNFKDIFTYSSNDFNNHLNVNNSFLSDLYDLGYQNVHGDSIAGILHQIVSTGREHYGEVPTDLELGRFLSVLANYINGPLKDDELVCDPAAGSGNLISSSLEILNISPNQILVNDINSKLLELLSLRLGLNYVSTISNNNSPKIHNENIADLNTDFFDNVKIILMNPPFVAGINSVDRRHQLYKKISEITSACKTNKGQMPLETVFLELITLLAKKGTTVACVFPKTHLTARGVEAKVSRDLILSNLGLRAIFTYPGEEIFNNVTKGTCVIVGKIGEVSENVKIISSYDKIPDIDLEKFSKILEEDFSEEFQSIMPGIVAKQIKTSILSDNVEDGWRLLNTELVEAIEFVRGYFESSNIFERFIDSEFTLIRGKAGNSGGSDLIFFDSREELHNQFKDADIYLSEGMRNARTDTFALDTGDSKVLDVNLNDISIIEEAVEAYISLPERKGRQRRSQKSKSEWLSILTRESRGKFSNNSILIPRGIRSEGRVYLAHSPIFVSTNFIVCSPHSYKDSLILSTWISTIFYQLTCEVSSKDQEGMRKMEISDINHTFIPKTEQISNETVELLENEKNNISFVNLKNPQIRKVDEIWANELFGINSEDVLIKAQRLLDFIVNRRTR